MRTMIWTAALLAIAACEQAHAIDPRLDVALAHGSISDGTTTALVARGDADEPTDADTAVANENARQHRTDLRVVDAAPAPGGFAAIVAVGGVTSPRLEVWVRLRLGGRDVACGGVVRSRYEAERMRALCLELRAT